MFANVLIANRGEIACRIIAHRAPLGAREPWRCRRPADRGALFTRLADETHEIGDGAEGYLDGEKSSRWRARVGAQCLHPGYGFLSENADFAEACANAGIVFVGPPPSAMRAMGLKSAAKALMAKAGAPVVPGYHGDNQSRQIPEGEGLRDRLSRADQGDRGRRRARHAPRRRPRRLRGRAGDRRRARRQAAFGDPRVLIEKYIVSPRHIEVQVFGDSARQRRASLRARLLVAAPPSEGDRGEPRAGPARGDARGDDGSRGRGGAARSATSTPARSSSSSTPRAASARTASISSR